jgi:hypothetical protein
MDPSQQRPGRRREGGFRLPNMALIASLFLHPSQSPLVGAAAVGHPIPATSDFAPRLHRRNDGEHVVLADCRDRSGIISSQIAYFAGEPGPNPEDVAVVVTEAGQAALWVNGNTSALFTNTGVTFTATLGPAVAEGQFAGTGENGYGNFSCYQSYVNALYVYSATTCSQVYLCDHSDPPPGEFVLIHAFFQGTLTCHPSSAGRHKPEFQRGHVPGHHHRNSRRRRRGCALHCRRGPRLLVLPSITQEPGSAQPPSKRAGLGHGHPVARASLGDRRPQGPAGHAKYERNV